MPFLFVTQFAVAVQVNGSSSGFKPCVPARTFQFYLNSPIFISMRKADIRKQALAARSALQPATYEQLNRQLLEQFTKLNFDEVKTLHIFLPITEKREPDTFLLIDWLRQHHPDIKIIVPKADFENARLSNHEYTGKGDLKKNLYNILEPQQGLIHTGEIEMVIVPLLAFDTRGYRVGYGKGFYDRFLQSINTRKIGLSLTDATEQIEDVHELDIRLDACITPNNTFIF